jgi:hypothetical protein
MFQSISVSFSPIVPWPVLVVTVLAVTLLTLWAYSRKLRGTSGAWRYLALGLRLLALLLCVLASLRPSVVLQEKKKQAASLVFLLDSSRSMVLADEVRGKTRWSVAIDALNQAREAGKSLGKDVDVKVYKFAEAVTEPKETELNAKAEPMGRETAVGSAMLEVVKQQEGTNRRIFRMVILSDFASNNGTNPLVAAGRLKALGVPVVTVGLGTENAGAGSRDIALRDLIASPTVFVKNQCEVRGTLLAKGFAGATLEVELHVEGETGPVARTRVKVPETGDVVPFSGVKYVPQTTGEKRITLKVAPQEGELVTANNEISTFVSVLSGGLNVKFIQGPNFSWDWKYLERAIMTSPDIQVDLLVIRRPAQGDKSEIDDAEFAPGRFNAYILADLPADFLTEKQQNLLVDAVKKGAGFMMLGGRSSFGAGGWADTVVAREILPVLIHPGDGQLEPEDGIKFVPTPAGLDQFVLQVAPSRAEVARIWEAMPPIRGTNRFSEVKPSAQILAETPGTSPEPLMVSMKVGNVVSIAYGGDTWVWARASDEGRLAHRKFWRQVIFYLSHKEHDSDNHVRLTLDRRRISVGEKLELTATSRDAKGASIPNVAYETTVEREEPKPTPRRVEVYPQGDEARGSLYAIDQFGQPGNYTARVVATRDGQEIGRDTARFLVYQDDRELENPSADLALARQIAEMTGGETQSPEKLAGGLKTWDRSAYTEYLSPSEYKVWDNWPFLLIFVALLTLEWWLRKRHGWV